MSWAFFDSWSDACLSGPETIMLSQRLSRHHHTGTRFGSQKVHCLRHRYWSPVILGAVLLIPGILLISTSPIAPYVRTTCFALITTGLCFILVGLIWATLEASRFRKRRQANVRLQRFRERVSGASSSSSPQPSTDIAFINMPPMPPSYFEVVAHDEVVSPSPPVTTSSTTTMTSCQTCRTSITVLPVLENLELQCQELDDIVITSEPPPPYAEAILDQEPIPERRYSV